MKKILEKIIESKNGIKALIEEGNIELAKSKVNEYARIMPGDVEIYSMQAIIAILEGDLNDAKRILEIGLSNDCYNFDLTYNMAYVFEISGNFLDAFIYYKKARNLVFFETERRLELEQIIVKIQRALLESNYSKTEEYIFSKTDRNILIIDFDLKKETNEFAKLLSELSFNVDLAYTGQQPEVIFPDNQLFYRKMIRFSTIQDLKQYILHYNFDIIHAISLPKVYQLQLKDLSEHIIYDDSNLIAIKNISDILEVYSSYQSDLKSKKSTEINENNTILIPTYNRPLYLERLLAYFSDFKELKPKIIVLDSSKEDSKQQNRLTVKKFSTLNLSYIEFESSKDFYEKLNFGLEMLDTKYVCLCADDDFLTEQGIITSLKMLEHDEDLFTVKGKNLYYIETMSKLKEYDFFNGLYDKDPIKRLVDITKGFVPSLIYQVFRSDRYKAMYSFIINNKETMPLNTTFQEYLMYFMVIISGRVGQVVVDLNVRIKGEIREVEIPNFPHAIVDGSFNIDFKKFKEYLRNYLLYFQIPVEHYDLQIDSIFSSFLNKFLNVDNKYIVLKNGEYDLKKLEIGMRSSWVWPSTLR